MTGRDESGAQGGRDLHHELGVPRALPVLEVLQVGHEGGVREVVVLREVWRESSVDVCSVEEKK